MPLARSCHKQDRGSGLCRRKAFIRESVCRLGWWASRFEGEVTAALQRLLLCSKFVYTISQFMAAVFSSWGKCFTSAETKCLTKLGM